MGGAADVVADYLKSRYTEDAGLDAALHLAVAALGHSVNDKGDSGDRVIPVEDLEVAVLDRTRSRPRKFVRLRPARLVELLSDRGPTEPAPDVPEDGPTEDAPPVEPPVAPPPPTGPPAAES